MPDFQVYWQVGVRAAHAEPLYRVTDDQYQFKYFPAFGMLAIPIGALPLQTAKVVWFCALVAALVLLLRLTLEVLPELRIPAALLVSALIICLGKYYVIELVIGQINLLFALVVATAMMAFKNGRDVLGGLLVALAFAVKPYGLILVPWLVARRRAPAVVAALAGAFCVFLLPAIAYGVRGAARMHLEWWRTVRDTTAGTLGSPDNVSLASMFTKWFGATPAAAWFTAVTTVLLLTTVAIVVLRRDEVPEPDGLEAALLVMLTPLLSPQGWGYVLVVSTPAIAVPRQLPGHASTGAPVGVLGRAGDDRAHVIRPDGAPVVLRAGRDFDHHAVLPGCDRGACHTSPAQDSLSGVVARLQFEAVHTRVLR